MRLYKLPDHDDFVEKMAKCAVSLECKNKDQLKRNLWQKIEFLETASWLEKVRDIGKMITLGRARKFLLKEIILGTINVDRRWYRSFDFRVFDNLFFGFRKIGAGLLAIIFLFVAVLQPWTNTNRVDAANYAYLDNVQGKVKIVRGDIELIATTGMDLRPSDRVFVGLDSRADVNFANDNLFRISENSELFLAKLEFPTIPSGRVGLELINGDGWFNIVNVGGKKSEFIVRANDLRLSLNDEGSGHLRVTPEFSRVVAVNGEVDLVLSHNRQLISTKLFPEQLIKIRNNKPFISSEERLRFVEKVSNEDLDYFERNLLADLQYESELGVKLKDKITKKAGLTPNDKLYPLEKFKRKARLALAFDKDQVKLDIAKDKFYEAQKVLQDGDTETAKVLLNDYKKEVVDLSLGAKKLSDTNRVKAESLKDNLDDSLVEQTRDLKLLEKEVELGDAMETIANVQKIADKLNNEDLFKEVEQIVVAESKVTGSNTIDGFVKLLEQDIAVKEVSPLQLPATDGLAKLPETSLAVGLPAPQITEEISKLQLDSLDVVVEDVLELKDVKQKTGVELVEVPQVKVIEPVNEPVKLIEQTTTNVVPVPTTQNLESGVEIQVLPVNSTSTK